MEKQGLVNLRKMSGSFGRLFEAGYVYKDVDDALVHWTETLGVGPFLLLRPFDAPVTYRGEIKTIKIAIAFAMWNDLFIELISPLAEETSVYREFLANGSQGLHHMAIFCKDYDKCIEYVERNNISKLQYGIFGATRYAYLDTAGNFLGTMTEFVEDTDEIKGLVSMCKELSESWDGTDPVRPFRS
jgi:hypothetical protein